MKYATNRLYIALSIIAFIVFFAAQTMRGVVETSEQEDTCFHIAIAGGVAFLVLAAFAFFQFAIEAFEDEDK